jgi:hypothetical protein
LSDPRFKHAAFKRGAFLLAAVLAAGTALAPGVRAQGTGLPPPSVPDTGTALPGLGDPSVPAKPSSPGGMPDATAPRGGIYSGTDLPPVPGSRQPILCPIVHAGRLLASSDVYDGTPLRGTLMRAHDKIWTLPPHEWPGDAYYISCEYGYDRPPLGIRLPQYVRSCRRPNDDPVQVACR